MKELHASIALALVSLAIAASAQCNTVQPRLIAQGCEGAGGDLWAMDESDFPTDCENIEIWKGN